MVILCDRHDVLLHRVLNNISQFFKSSTRRSVCYNITKLKDLVGLFKTKIKDKPCVILQDPLVLLIVFLLKPMARSNFVYFCLEMWGYDVPNNSPILIIRNIIFLLGNRLALFLSPVLIFSNDLRRKFYIDKYPNIEEKSFIFENYHLANKITAQPTPSSDKFQSKLDHIKNKHKVITCYAGGIQRGRNVFMIASVVNKMSSNICFVVAGEDRIGINWSMFKNGNVYYLGPLSEDELNQLYGIAQWGFMDYDNVLLNTRYCAPLKLYEYLAFGMGIISNENYSMLQKKDLIDFYYADEQQLESVLRQLANLQPIQKQIEEYDFSLRFEELLGAIALSKGWKCS